MTIAKLIAGRGTEIWSCHADDSVAQAVEMLASKRIGALPVRDEGSNVAGIFSERDVLYCLNTKGAAALDLKVREVMTATPITIAPGTQILEALGLMTKRRIRHLPVVENDALVAFVSIGDLVKYRIDSIEAEADALRSYIQTA